MARTGCVPVCVCVCVLLLNYVKYKNKCDATDAVHKIFTQQKLFSVAIKKKKNKKNTLLAFVLDFLALLPFLRIWVAVVLAL